MKIEGSVAIVTGGAQGIGEHICRALLEKGGKVRSSSSLKTWPLQSYNSYSD